MKSITLISAITFVLFASTAKADELPSDSASASSGNDSIFANINLKEVVVTAAEFIQRGDRKVYFPTLQQRKLSSNGLSLLEKMQLNGLQVNSLFNTVDVSGGGTPLFCINGRPVELQDILALKPDEVAKVEYNDNPGARYKDAALVINYKLRNALQGGGFSTDLMEAVNTVYGVNRLSGKYDYKNSEWSLNYNMQHAAFKEFYNQNEETYLYDNNQEVTQTETGIPGRLHYNHHWLTLNYNYLKQEKYMLNVAFRGKSLNTPTQELTSLLQQSGSSDTWSLYNFSKNRANTASLDIYFQRMFRNGQTLIFDIVGGYTSTNNKLDYSISTGGNNLYSITNDVDGNKYSLIAEGLYEKSSGSSKWSIGLKHSLGYANNRYSGTETTDNRLHNSNTYGYTEWSHTLGPWNYSVSIGADYLWFSQKDKGYDRFYFQPMLRMGFTPSDNFFIRYRGSMESLSPSLSELSETRQTLDNFQIRQGNPSLRPSTEYKNQITFDYHRKSWSTCLNVNYQYIDNVIMETTSQDGDWFVRSMANQNCWQKFNVEYELRLRLLKGMLSFRGALGMDCFDCRASDYHHSYSNIYGIVNAEIAYRFIALTFNLRTHRPTLYGETLTLGEDLHDIALTYFKKRFTITLAMNNPFMNNYKVGSENWNRNAHNNTYQYVNETSRMLLVKLTYGLDFGNKHKNIIQQIQNEDNDTGVVKGSK